MWSVVAECHNRQVSRSCQSYCQTCPLSQTRLAGQLFYICSSSRPAPELGRAQQARLRTRLNCNWLLQRRCGVRHRCDYVTSGAPDRGTGSSTINLPLRITVNQENGMKLYTWDSLCHGKPSTWLPGPGYLTYDSSSTVFRINVWTFLKFWIEFIFNVQELSKGLPNAAFHLEAVKPMKTGTLSRRWDRGTATTVVVVGSLHLLSVSWPLTRH